MSNEKKLPYDAVTGEELPPKETPGFYPGFSTMKQAAYWDQATRDVVAKRFESPSQLRFFNAQEARVLESMLARLIPQEDRTPERRISIIPWIDQRLFRNEISGFRYDTMPPDQEAYRLGISAVAAMANERFSLPFEKLTVHQQELLLKSIHDGEPEPDHKAWKQMDVHRWWAMVMEDAATIYYAHPWAWDEIGFGGPAYPRGYMRLENGLPEPWEVDEHRYEWNAPVDSLSGETDNQLPPEHGSSHGHGGTH